MAYNKTVWQDLPNTTTPINATNLNKIEDELELLDQSAGIPTDGIIGYDGSTIPAGYEETEGIIESGSNVNGKYIKYNDGTMICWNTFTKSQITTTQAWGSLYWSDAITPPNFPVSFINVPTVTMTPTGSTDSYWMINEGDVSTTKPMNFRFVRATSRTGGSCIMNYIAIGKWK